MRLHAIKLAVTVVVLSLAFGALLWASLQDGTEYFKHVDEVMVNPASWQGRPLKLHGFVVPGSIVNRPDSFQYRFSLEHNGRVVDASYEGIVPDTFKDQSEVVLTGRLIVAARPEGRAYEFATNRDGIMAKCPSKYDALTEPGKGRPAFKQES
jgi:cytochrome c-type biogenesis protein CcmE